MTWFPEYNRARLGDGTWAVGPVTMNETEWLTSSDPQPMLKVVCSDAHGRIASDRQLRLFAVACQERFLPGRAEEYRKVRETDGQEDNFHLHLLNPVQVAQLWCDLGMVSGNRLLADRNRKQDHPFKAALLREIFGNPWKPLTMHFETTFQQLRKSAQSGVASTEPVGSCPLLTWNDGTVPKLSETIYSEGAWERMPILADALEEAGYHDVAVLNHCRGVCDYPGCIDGWIMRTDDRLGADLCRRCRDAQGKPIPPIRHVKGCHVADWLTGRE